MSTRIGWSRILILLLLGIAFAGISNLAASRERKMAWVGTYSRALEAGAASSETASVAAPGAAAPAASEVPSTTPAALPATAAPAASSKAFPPHPDQASLEIGSDDAEQLFREGRVFLDARRTSAYADGHIPKARSFPVWESDIADRVKAFYEEGLDQNAPIVIYCSGGDCEDSHMLAEKLYMVGFNNLLLYKDGFPGWQKRGLPSVKGPKP